MTCRRFPRTSSIALAVPGRMGSTGRASTLVSGAEIGELRSIERALKLKIARKQVNASGRIADTLRAEHVCPRARCPACRAKCSRKKYGHIKRVVGNLRYCWNSFQQYSIFPNQVRGAAVLITDSLLDALRPLSSLCLPVCHSSPSRASAAPSYSPIELGRKHLFVGRRARPWLTLQNQELAASYSAG